MIETFWGLIEVNFNWLIVIKYRITDLKNELFKKVLIAFLRILNNSRPTKIPIELPDCGSPDIGKELTEGSLVFSGVSFDLDIDNPWLIESPSPEVELYLHGFFWLNDLSAYGNSKARRLSLEWLSKWIFYNSFGKQIGWEPNIAALRSINFLQNLYFLKGGTDRLDKEHFKTLRQQYFFLTIMVKNLRPGIKKLNVLYSIFLIAKAYGFPNRSQQKFLKFFCKVVQSHIDLDGQILSRNPQELFDCFVMISEILNMTKSTQLISKYDHQILQNRREKIVPVLRGLRLGNGLLTRSHGGDSGSLQLIDKYLMDSDVKTRPLVTKLLGFERITAGRLTLIVDCAKPTYGVMGDNSHASCLSFELTSGQRPIFVNCGPGGRFGNAFKRFCRSTQAHNCCTLGNVSQSKFKFISKKKYWPKEIICNGPKNVRVDRYKNFEATWLDLSQDSYEEEYGYIHYRKLFVLNTGKVFTGTDIFETSERTKKLGKKIDNFYAYFQLHPDVEVWDHPRLQTIILRLKNGEHWIFEIDLGQVSVEESTFINTLKSYPEKTKRIVIKSSSLLTKTEIKWSLRRREIVNRNTRDSEIVQ